MSNLSIHGIDPDLATTLKKQAQANTDTLLKETCRRVKELYDRVKELCDRIKQRQKREALPASHAVYGLQAFNKIS